MSTRKCPCFNNYFKWTYLYMPFLHLLNVANSSMMHECFQVFSSVCIVFKCSKLRDFCKSYSTQFPVFSLSQVINCSYGYWTDWSSTTMLAGNWLIKYHDACWQFFVMQKILDKYAFCDVKIFCWELVLFM